MPRPLAVVALVVCAVISVRTDEPAIGSLRLPLPAAELSAAIGIHRVDPSTLPVDIVRLAFASPDNASADETSVRARVTQALAARGKGDLVPLPLSPRVWRDHVFRVQVRDEDLAAAIFSRRDTALVYHALLGMDRDTLAWIERNPAVLRSLAAHPGTAAVFASAIRIRGGAIDTPGEASRELWEALVGADPSAPAAFVNRLLAADAGAVAAFYHAIAGLDPIRQAFAIGRGDDPRRIERARDLLHASRPPSAGWSSDRPFGRADIDLLSLIRTIAVDDRGRPRPPASRALWARVFGQGSGDGIVDAAWLARHILGAPIGSAKRRLDVFRFAQRTLGEANVADADLLFVLREHMRFPLLMSVLETFGERQVAAYAAAARAAAAVEGDDVTTTLFQAGLAIVDRARRTASLADDDARTLSRSLARASIERDGRRAIAAWFGDTLVPALASTVRVDLGDGRADAEHVVLQALAGRRVTPPIVVRWEDTEYVADLAVGERRRLDRIRRSQKEMPLDTALAQARDGKTEPLAHSLAGLVYACALGGADLTPIDAGTVWRRHRFRANIAAVGGPPTAWRLATEVFAAEGWYLAGSLLRLDLALAPLALRRLDTTEMPAASHLSTSDRRTLAVTIALMDPRRLADAERDAIAAALARGRERIARLAENPGGLERAAADAALSGWRQNRIAWLLAHDPSRVPGAFTLLEQWRLGGGEAADGWGAAGWQIDGCLCLRQPGPAPWEDYTGRASTGQLGTQFAEVSLRTADVLSAMRLPALLARDVAAYAMQDAIDRSRTAYFDDWLPLAIAVRELPDDRFVDYVAALTALGPLSPRSKQ